MTSDAPEDRRKARTRAALREAFVSLALERRWSQVTIAEIILRAGVGRSTFYEHFRNKEELLRDSLAGPLGVLADCATPEGEAELAAVMAHFWDNRRIGNWMLAGAPRAVATKLLIALIEERLTRRGRGVRCTELPAPLLAAYLGAAQIAVLAAWLGGQASATPDAIAAALTALARSALTSPG